MANEYQIGLHDKFKEFHGSENEHKIKKMTMEIMLQGRL